MSRIALTNADFRLHQARRHYVPLASTLFACLLALLPVVVNAPYVPDLAFLTLISWRLLRPDLWTAKAVLPIGLFNDLVAGHPLGQSMALWTIAVLLLDLVETRVVFRDFWMDWLFAAVLIIFYTAGDWYIGRLMGSATHFSVMLPQLGLSLAAYPLIAWLIVGLDRWRLAR
jgi:rod shape-determining protein MreD